MTAPLEASGDNGALSEWTEHLEELRSRIISVLVIWVAATVAAFAFSEQIAAFLMEPVAGLEITLYTFAPADKFIAHLNLSMIAGFAVTLPFFILQAGLFVWPGLMRGEKYWLLGALTVAPLLFAGGCVVAYTVFVPIVMKFFISFAASDGVVQMWGFRGYLGLLSGLMLAVGLLLQMPLILTVCFALGVLSPRKVAELRTYIILLIFLTAALCTPPDVASQLMLGIPLYLLFELTLLVGRIFERYKNR